VEWEIRLWRSAEGAIPFSEWFQSIADDRTRQRIDARLARLRLGNFGDCKSLGGGLYELRIDVGPGFRIYFGQSGRQVVILLCGGDKSTQRADINKARKYWASLRK
jgi:putative addiction module killer protein